MRVIFQIEGASPVEIECNAGDNLLELARRANVAIDAPCSGNGSCGKCRVKLIEGDVESFPSRHITDEEYEAGWRLSCNCKVASNQRKKQIIERNISHCHKLCTQIRTSTQFFLAL